MFRRIYKPGGLAALALLGSFLFARPVAAQNEGYSLWSHRNDTRTRRGLGNYISPDRPAPFYYVPAAVRSAPAIPYRSYYYAPRSEAAESSPVFIDVLARPGAEIWFDGTRTTQTGPDREFVSPPLSPEHSYSYDVRVRWSERGREIDQTRHVTFYAGDRILLDFRGEHLQDRQSY
jgi:uncharacterized protein (TIGR03000 family)